MEQIRYVLCDVVFMYGLYVTTESQNLHDFVTKFAVKIPMFRPLQINTYMSDLKGALVFISIYIRKVCRGTTCVHDTILFTPTQVFRLVAKIIFQNLKKHGAFTTCNDGACCIFTEGF